MLFEVEAAAARNKRSGETYDEFVGKFESKLTTDDCYTPAPVYDAVLGWVREQCNIEGCNIVRPFYPGGDYENYAYGDSDVVIDNPPFSILSRIITFYNERGIRYFLFAPHMTVFSTAKDRASVIIVEAEIIYHNGAKVKTAFISNMFDDDAIIVSSDLKYRIADAQKNNTKKQQLPKYIYPPEVLTISTLARCIRGECNMRIKRSSVRFISKLKSQRAAKCSVYGGGYLASRRVAAERVAAERAAAERAAEREAIVWGLSPEELKIIDSLN